MFLAAFIQIYQEMGRYISADTRILFENVQGWLSSYYYLTTLQRFQLQFLVSLLQ